MEVWREGKSWVEYNREHMMAISLVYNFYGSMILNGLGLKGLPSSMRDTKHVFPIQTFSLHVNLKRFIGAYSL